VGSCPQCARVLCARCARERVSESRFLCPDCMVPLKLTDPRIVHLLRASIRDSGAAAGAAVP